MDTKDYEFKLCENFYRYCKHWKPSMDDFNKIVAYNTITIITENKLCNTRSKKDEKIVIEQVDDEPITMFDVVIHMMLHHKHKEGAHTYFEGLSDLDANLESVEDVIYTRWGN